MTFGQRLAAARKRAGISQRELAKILGVSYGAVGNWESGLSTPDPDTIAKIARALRVSADELVGTADADLPSNVTVETAAAHANPPPPGVDLDEWERQARARLEQLLHEIRQDWERTKRQRGG